MESTNVEEARKQREAIRESLRGEFSVGSDVVVRYEENPIILYDALPFRCSDILNAGAVRVGDEYVLLLTIERMEGNFALYTARSKDGYSFAINERPLLAPMHEGQWAIYEGMGVLDARITYLEDTYYITYDALGRHGHCLALARTDDFESALRLGTISEPDNKSGALFPKRINGRYVRLERPWTGDSGSIWVAYSDDLVYWGGYEIVMTPREGFWDASRIAPATPPVEIDKGWLFIYGGIKDTSGGPLFRLGAAILDKDNPANLLARTNVPILTPRMPYERVGDVPNMVYSCGAIVEDNQDIKLYYGAADSCICVGTSTVSKIVEACMESGREY